MGWFIKMFGSSLGKKLLMSLTGLFLIIFLIVHLMGNLAIFSHDGGLAFNAYSKFMTTNPLIKTVSYLLYASIILHAVVAFVLTGSNKAARPVNYKQLSAKDNSSWESRSMTLLGTLILGFIILHLKDFWWQYKFGSYEFAIDDNGNRDLYALVVEQFSKPAILVIYLVGLLVLSLHLKHGFQSAFQTLGINHHKYTPAIKKVGLAYSIIVPLCFAAMPVYIYFFK